VKQLYSAPSQPVSICRTAVNARAVCPQMAAGSSDPNVPPLLPVEWRLVCVDPIKVRLVQIGTGRYVSRTRVVSLLIPGMVSETARIGFVSRSRSNFTVWRNWQMVRSTSDPMVCHHEQVLTPRLMWVECGETRRLDFHSRACGFKVDIDPSVTGNERA